MELLLKGNVSVFQNLFSNEGLVSGLKIVFEEGRGLLKCLFLLQLETLPITAS